jgi:hypothetical protein
MGNSAELLFSCGAIDMIMRHAEKDTIADGFVASAVCVAGYRDPSVVGSR